MTQEHATVGTAPALVTRWEVHTDIAECQRSEQRVAERVQRDVAIGMRHQPTRVVDAHTAKNNMIARPEGVDVVAGADTWPEIHERETLSC